MILTRVIYVTNLGAWLVFEHPLKVSGLGSLPIGSWRGYTEGVDMWVDRGGRQRG